MAATPKCYDSKSKADTTKLARGLHCLKVLTLIPCQPHWAGSGVAMLPTPCSEWGEGPAGLFGSASPQTCEELHTAAHKCKLTTTQNHTRPLPWLSPPISSPQAEGASSDSFLKMETISQNDAHTMPNPQGRTKVQGSKDWGSWPLSHGVAVGPRVRCFCGRKGHLGESPRWQAWHWLPGVLSPLTRMRP